MSLFLAFCSLGSVALATPPSDCTDDGCTSPLGYVPNMTVVRATFGEILEADGDFMNPSGMTFDELVEEAQTEEDSIVVICDRSSDSIQGHWLVAPVDVPTALNVGSFSVPMNETEDLNQLIRLATRSQNAPGSVTSVEMIDQRGGDFCWVVRM
jgi:hypothetical protein